MSRNRVRQSNFAWGPLFLLTLLVGTMAMPTQTHAAGLLDWLFPRRAERVARRWSRSTQAYRPVASLNGYTGGNTSYYGGNFAGGQNFGSGSYYPSYGSWNGWGYQSNAAANTRSTYRPTTVYRTQWQAVPVTTYSPVQGGAYQQPCNSYEWQALRVPYTAYQPATSNVAWGSAAAAPAASSCACGSHGATTAGYNAALNRTPAGYGTGWQAVAPATAPAAVPANVAPSLGATTAGYGSRVDYANATQWQPVDRAAGAATTTTSETDWQPVASGERRQAARPLAKDVRSATEWQPVEKSERDYEEPAPANRRPRLEDSAERQSFYRDKVIEQYERERDAIARERELLRRERETLQEELRKARDDQGWRPGSTDRYSDWDTGRDRNEYRRPVNRYEDDFLAGDRYPTRTAPERRTASERRTAPVTTYLPPIQSQTSSTDRERSEYYNHRRTEDRNAYRPMLDDGWSYDKNDSRSQRYESGYGSDGGSGSRNAYGDRDAYDWRTSGNERSYSTKTRAIPASMPNHQPAAKAPRGVMPLLLRPIPETKDAWNTQKGPKLLGPQDRTASLPTTRRWQAIPVSHAKVVVESKPATKLNWRSVAK